MLNQSFSRKNLRYTSIKTWKKHATTSNYQAFLKHIINQISIKNSDNGYTFSKFTTNTYKNKTGYNFACPEDEVIAQKVNDNLRRLFKVKPADRHAIIKQTISLAKDSQPFSVARVDIKDFYESLKRQEIINFITNEWLLSHQSKLALKNWDAQLSAQGITGLPRGMSLSSTLSEIKMRSFDKSIKQEEGVYFYARYVDDIIIFYSGEVSKLERLIAYNLAIKSPELRINYSKSQFYTFNDTGISNKFDIDYLGYKISAVINPSKEKNQEKYQLVLVIKKLEK
ncbi:RNA-directed DNA polymerase [Halomonas sp. LY9]